MDKNMKKWASNAEFGYFPTINGENFTKPELKFIFKNMYISKRHTKNQGIRKYSFQEIGKQACIAHVL